MTGASPSSRVFGARARPAAAAVLGEVDRGVGELLEHRVDRLGLRRRAAVVLLIASTIASLGASATSISRFRTNRSLSMVSKSMGRA